MDSKPIHFSFLSPKSINQMESRGFSRAFKPFSGGSRKLKQGGLRITDLYRGSGVAPPDSIFIQFQ